MKTGVCKIQVSPCRYQQDASPLVFQGQWTGSLLSQSYGKSSCITVLGICKRTHHLWGLSVKVLIDQAGAFSPTAEVGPTSASTSHKTAPSAQLACLLLACPKLSLTITVFILYCDNTKLLLLLITRDNVHFIFSQKTFMNPSFYEAQTNCNPQKLKIFAHPKSNPGSSLWLLVMPLHYVSSIHGLCLWSSLVPGQATSYKLSARGTHPLTNPGTTITITVIPELGLGVTLTQDSDWQPALKTP